MPDIIFFYLNRAIRRARLAATSLLVKALRPLPPLPLLPLPAQRLLVVVVAVVPLLVLLVVAVVVVVVETKAASVRAALNLLVVVPLLPQSLLLVVNHKVVAEDLDAHARVMKAKRSAAAALVADARFPRTDLASSPLATSRMSPAKLRRLALPRTP